MAPETINSDDQVRLPRRNRWRDALAALFAALDPWDRVLLVGTGVLEESAVLVALTHHRVIIVNREPARVLRSPGRAAIRACGAAHGELTLETAVVSLRLRMRRRARERMLHALAAVR